MKIFFRYFVVLLLLPFSLLLNAGTNAFNEDALKERVNARWESIIKHEFGEAYRYETPTYKAVFTKKLYVSQFGQAIDWNLTKIDNIKYDSATGVADVMVTVETKPRNSTELDSEARTASVEVHEKWLHIRGQWWHSSNE